MKNLHRVIVSAILLTSGTGVIASCSPEVTSETEQSFGQTSIPLQTTSSKGIVYRLQPAGFTIQNTDDPSLPADVHNAPTTEDTFTTDLAIGNYDVTLNDGWRLKRKVVANDGTVTYSTLAVEDTLLLSDQTQSVAIVEQEVSPMIFAFKVGDDLIQFGEGRLEVDITVDDSEAPDCLNNNDCPDGVCDPSTSECVGCLTDGNCADGVCDLSTQECVGCLSDDDCTTAQYCDLGTSECVDPQTDFADPDFMTGVPWDINGAATVDTGATGNTDAGVAHFTPTAICEGGSVTQDLDLWFVAADGPHEVTLNVDVEEAVDSFLNERGEAAVTFGSFKQALGELYYGGGFTAQSLCLGERAYQAGTAIGFAGAPPSECSGASAPYDRVSPFAIDNVAVAAAPSCPAVGEVINGDFEAGDTGWTKYEGTNSSAAIDTSSGDWAATLGVTNVCANAYITGQLSPPLASTLPNPALELSVNGGLGDELSVRMNDYDALTELFGTGAEGTTRICLAGWAQGISTNLQFNVSGGSGTCANANVKSFTLDDLGFVSAPECAGSEYLADGGFEVSTNAGFASGWQLDSRANNQANASAVIDMNAAAANSGNASLSLTAAQRCSSATAYATYLVPDAAGTNGPAIKFWYTYGSGSITSARVENDTLTPAASYTQHVTCIDPGLIGTTQSLSVYLSGGSGTCAETYTAENFRIDDIEVTTDASCPAL